MSPSFPMEVAQCICCAQSGADSGPSLTLRRPSNPSPRSPLLGSFGLIRTQTTIGDTAFLRSMIPHHSGAILMCEQASLKDAEIRELCRTIIAGQAAEIEQMKSILVRK